MLQRKMIYQGEIYTLSINILFFRPRKHCHLKDELKFYKDFIFLNIFCWLISELKLESNSVPYPLVRTFKKNHQHVTTNQLLLELRHWIEGQLWAMKKGKGREEKEDNGSKNNEIISYVKWITICQNETHYSM